MAATLHITSITSYPSSCPTPLYFLPPPRPSFMGTLGTCSLLPAPRWMLLGRFHPGPPDLWILCWTKCSFCLFCERFLKGQCQSLFNAFASLFGFCGHWTYPRYCGLDVAAWYNGDNVSRFLAGWLVSLRARAICQICMQPFKVVNSASGKLEVKEEMTLIEG